MSFTRARTRRQFRHSDSRYISHQEDKAAAEARKQTSYVAIPAP